jgi:membrane associated rhomboid family serine protease
MSQLPPTIPVCYRHPSRETYVRCSRCDRPICPDCMREASVGHQCPECVREGKRTQRPVRTAFGGSSVGRHGYATITLMAINVLMLIGAAISARSGNALAGGTGWGGLLGSETPLHDWGSVLGHARYGNPPEVHGIAEGEYYRLITGMFLQYGLLHLLLNMWALWVLGRVLEAVLGPARFLALYLTAGLGGNVAAYLFSSPSTPTAGASGAIFGLFAALFIVLRRMGRDTSAVVPILVINLVFTFTVSNISIAGHLGGLITGGLVALGMAYAPQVNRTLIQYGSVVAVLLVLVVLTVVRTTSLTG